MRSITHHQQCQCGQNAVRGGLCTTCIGITPDDDDVRFVLGRLSLQEEVAARASVEEAIPQEMRRSFSSDDLSAQHYQRQFVEI